MSRKEFKYDAFISYRHAELDSFVAELLHKQLESFKVPRLADKEIKETGKQGIKRVFRDKDELPLAGNLSAPITEALKESEFLIVICSPRTIESLWVQREIETFLEYRDASHVLAVLIEGEPSEAFPPQLCTMKQQITAEDGTVTYEEKAIEPLAADVRGSSKKEIKAKMKSELLRMAAPMLGCEYDDLKQRHRERRMKRLLTIFAAAGSICLAFGAFSTYQALRIRKQSKQIQAQSQDLKALQSKSLSSSAIDAYEDGDRLGGLLIALAGVPDNLKEPERPIVAESTAALAKILQVYENETSFAPHLILAHDTITETSVLNTDGTILVSKDQLGQLYSWDVDTGEMLAKIEDPVEVQWKENLAFADENAIVCAGNSGIACLDARDLSVKWIVPDVSVSKLVLSEDGTMAAAAEGTSISIYETAAGNVIGTYTNERYSSMGSCMGFSPDGNYFAASLTSFFDEGKGKGILLRTSDWEVVWMCETKFTSLSEILPSNEGECFALSYDRSVLGEFGMTMNQNLTCFHEDGTVRFEIDGMMAISSPIQFMGENIVYPDGSSICIVSGKDGSLVREIHYNANVCNFVVMEEDGAILVGLSDGTVLASIIKEKDVLNRQYMEAGDDKMRHIYHYFNKIIEEPVNSNKILIYQNALGEQAQKLVRVNTTVYDVEASESHGLLLVYADDRITAYKNDGQKELYYFKPEDTVREIILMEEENRFLLIEGNQAEAYQLSDGRPLEQAEITGGFYYYRDNMLYTLNKDRKMIVYDMKNLKNATEYDAEILSQGCVSGDGNILVGITSDKSSFFYNVETKEQTDLKWKGDILISNIQGTKYLVADAEADQVSIYSFGETVPEASIEVKENFINAAGFSPDGKKIFISFKDDSIKIYKTSGLSLIKTIENVPGINQWDKTSADRLELLYNKEGSVGYLFNENMELLYEIPGFKKISGDGKKIYSSSGAIVFSFPVYDLKMLVDEAKKVLNGREMTQEEKKQYYVD